MTKRTLNPTSICTATCKHCANVDHDIVIPDLALTPTQVKEMTDRGIAVSLPNAQFYEDQKAGDWHVEPMFRRSMSREELWETEQSSRKRLIAAHKSDKRKYGTVKESE